jgi:uncharacterized protein YecE (DUF72 family)
MNETIRVGTSGYSFDDWVGSFYPPGVPRGKRLDYYVQHFSCVEINSTYYGIPHPAVMAKIVEKTPENFEFTVKAYRDMTHRNTRDPAQYSKFLECLEPIRNAGKFSGVVLQFPFGFQNTAENRAHIAHLRQVLPDMDLWAEFRNDAWNRNEIFRFLEDVKVGFIAVDEPPIPGLFPPVARVTTDVAYVRFHGRNVSNWYGRGKNERYDWDYTRDELAGWMDRIHEMASRARKTYLFFNNCYMGRAVKSARLMTGLLSDG